jgi:hypothetical protein
MVMEGFIFSDSGSVYDDSLTAVYSHPFLPGPVPHFRRFGQRVLFLVQGEVFLSDPIPSYPFEEGFLRPNGWRGSSWFGWVNTKDYPWVYQYPAGWIYILGPDEDSCWMWDYCEGWFWTNQFYWPTIWSKDNGWRAHKRMKAEG